MIAGIVWCIFPVVYLKIKETYKIQDGSNIQEPLKFLTRRWLPHD